MAGFTCYRCGADIPPDGDRLTVSVLVRRDPEDRETLAEYELCEDCAAESEDHLVLETTYHEPT